MGHQLELAPGARSEPRFELHLPGKSSDMLRAMEQDLGGFVRGLGADYVLVLAADENARATPVTRLREHLRSTAELAFRATSDSEDSGRAANMSFRYRGPAWSRPFVRVLFESHCMGPTLELYRVR